MARIVYATKTGEIKYASTDDARECPLADGESNITVSVPDDFWDVGPQFYKIEEGKPVIADQTAFDTKKARLTNAQRITDMCSQLSGMSEEQFLALSEQQRWLLLFNVVKRLVEKSASRRPAVALQSGSPS
jgi:hypothetical protein